MPTKLGNGGTSQEAYNPQDGKYTDEGNVSKEEQEAMNLLGLNKSETNSENFAGSSYYNKSAIQKDFTESGYVTEQGSATFDDIYNDFTLKNGKEPENLDEIIGFVRDEVMKHKGPDIPYKVMVKARAYAKPSSDKNNDIKKFVETPQSKKVKQDFDMLYQTEKNSATFEDIYSDYVNKNQKEPSSLQDLIDFVTQEVHNHYDEGKKKGYTYDQLQYNMPYYVKQKPFVKPGSYVTKKGPSFRVDVESDGITPESIMEKFHPGSEEDFYEVYEKWFNGGKR